MVNIREERERPVDFYRWLEEKGLGLRTGEHVKSVGGYYVCLDGWDITDGYVVGGGIGRGLTMLNAIRELAFKLEDKVICHGSSDNGTLHCPRHFILPDKLPEGLEADLGPQR